MSDGKKYLTEQEALALDVPLYNKAIEMQWPAHKAKFNLSGDLSTCEHCSRKYVICCICDTAKKRWEEMLTNIREVNEHRLQQEQ
jgi:hypothetical protein